MFFQTLLFSALATAVVAQEASRVLFFTRVPNPVTAGQPQAITYSTNDTSTPVTIILRKGLSTNLDTIATLTTSANGGQYVWTPSGDLENGIDYALQIEQGSQTNYFGPFQIQGASGTGDSSSSSSSTGTSSSSSSSMTSTASYPAGNATHTSTGTGAFGTGTSMSGNSTMTSTSSRSSTSNTATPTTSGGDLQNTEAAAPTETGAASSIMAGGSAIALVLGAVGAIVLG